MFGSDVIHSTKLIIDADPGGDAEMFYLMRAPKALTVDAVYMVSEQAQGAGTAVRLRLENWGTAGSSVQGTVTDYVGGTAVAAQLAARTPGAGSVNRAQNYVAAGEWLVVNYNEQQVGWVSGDRFMFQVDYVLGKGNTTSTS